MLFKNRYENGIRVVQDIVSENGELYTFEQLNKYIYNKWYIFRLSTSCT